MPFKLYFTLCVYACGHVCGAMHVSVSAHGSRRHQIPLEPLELQSQAFVVVSYPVWLRTGLTSSEGVVCALTCGIVSPALLM